MKVYPSLSEAHVPYLSIIIEALDPYVDGYHIDIMDSHFVFNLSWGPTLVKVVSAYTKKTLWLHCMVTQPEKILALYTNKNHKYIISVHQETITDWTKIQKYKQTYDVSFGIALDPATDISTMLPYIKDIDHILIMTVQPGASGQPFLTDMWDKIDHAHQLCVEYNPKCVVAVDGGVTLSHLMQLKNKSVEMIAAFSAIFGDEAIKSVCQYNYEMQEKNINQYLELCVNKIKQIKAV
ncbi:hypothetical protein EKK58_03800 [Candidatus Dependentiae bacterium]|nr:MAG: hypothetical protein EKK58_03800 [Candidatus Dependentiae bacterium]